MVDMALLSQEHSSAASAERMRKRHSSEWRLKLYGILAIGLAAAALVALMSTVVGKAVGALTESYVTIATPLPADKISPDDPGAANYDGFRKDALKALFPTVTNRRDKRSLYDLTSGGAAFELRDQIIADPSAIGSDLEYRYLMSDDADLYLKGRFGRLAEAPHNGRLSPTGTEGEIELLSTSNDFADDLAWVKEDLVERAARLRRDAVLQGNGVTAFTARAAKAKGEEQRQKLLAAAQGYATQRALLISKAEELETRANNVGGEELLNEDLPSILVRIHGGWVKATSLSASGLRGEVVTPLQSTDEAAPEAWELFIMETPEASRKISDKQLIWIETLRDTGAVETVFNWRFFTSGDSREAELAGIWGATVGTFWTMLVTFLVAFPVGVLGAIYLEEFAPKTRITDFIEVNINNLAAVPSIVFGLLGLTVFLTWFGVPRSAPLAGGLVLALMTLPTIIIASRAAIRAVPPSIRDAALGLGASRVQTTFHHVLPLAMPGILTGTILGMAQALGETAPLIMIGMVAFIVDIPGGVTDSATVLPVQVFRWSDFPERAFEMRTAAAICVLLVFLVAMNALAVMLRKRFERRW